ncbi:MAG: phenylacetic acid degradation operon negative regulatory protein [Parcubacteria group bacterium Athens0714_16]|nr:MAG: phenylacetic acid degradation operon negative regulatory protein [Parcubacteria group bacterium Athens0714_16]
MLGEDKQKIINISKLILKSLFAISIAVVLISLPGMAKVVKLFETDKNYRNKFNREISRLKRNGYVKTYNKNGKIMLEITKKGIKLVKKYNFEEIKLRKEIKWDKYWRMVMFDIPENNRSARRSLRTKLDQLGFAKYQKSVFIYPYSCRDEINFISNYFNIEEFVNYIVAKRIDNEEKFKKFFEL